MHHNGRFNIINLQNIHNHEAETAEKRLKGDVGKRLKRKAIESPHQKPSKLICKEVSSFIDIVTKRDIVNYRK